MIQMQNKSCFELKIIMLLISCLTLKISLNFETVVDYWV